MPLPIYTIKTGAYGSRQAVATRKVDPYTPQNGIIGKTPSPYATYVLKGKNLLAENSESILLENGEFLVYE